MADLVRAVLELIAGMIFFTTMYILGVEYFGYFGYLTFSWIVSFSILIVFILWLRMTKKGIFAIDEEE
jgi:hypothetical protein